MANGFLGRWSERKLAVKEGKPVEAEPAHPEVVIAAKAAIHDANTKPVAESAGAHAMDPGLRRDDSPPPVTLEDAQALTPDADFKPFMAGNVGPEVRNAAMKKLFADPHFNVMDGLDIYIDDYSKSEPLPESMLRQMASAKFLKLFDDDEDSEKQKDPTFSPRENANNPDGETVAQSDQNPERPPLDPAPPEIASQPETLTGSGRSQEDHAHTDLRLQPDHAAPAPDAGCGT
ncbi:DUF3306 domain-containing protein [Polaromonas sp.]|uniref:DUF3306 domain-containing protein n=1 Tax=Polaromonas sp. TaxID=1869339 RepID=UPI002FC6717A